MTRMAEVAKLEFPELNHGFIFPKQVPLAAELDFFMKRPKSDFVGNNRENGRLKASASNLVALPYRPDIDNLIKFVLDALNGVLYHDDCQVVKVSAIKLRDNLGACNGRTIVKFYPYHYHHHKHSQ